MMFMELDPEKMGDVDDDSDLMVSIPLGSTEEREAYDVAKETETLYQIHLWCRQDCLDNPRPTSIHQSTKVWTDRSLHWWSMTGGWKNVDKSIRDKYPQEFIAALGMFNSMLPAVNALVRETRKQNAAKKAKAAVDAAAAAAGFGPRPKTSEHKRPFDVVGATRGLYEVARRTIKTSTAPPHEVELLFEKLAGIWWEETGGPEHIDKAIIRSYPDWFIGKLELFKRDQGTKNMCEPQPGPASASSSASKKPDYDVARETQFLFEKASERFPKAPRGMNDTAPSMQLELNFMFLLVEWCQKTGGWDNIDKSIRKTYPKWFIDYTTKTNKQLPIAKMMAFDGWANRTVVK